MAYPVNIQASLKLLILVKESEFRRVQEHLHKVALLGWQSTIDIDAIDDSTLRRNEFNQLKNKKTTDIISRYDEGSFGVLFVQRDLPLDISRIIDAEIDVQALSSIKTLLNKIDEFLKSHKLYWLNYANDEWGKSAIKYANPDTWVQQFSELGYEQIAKHLLKCLRVVTDAELREAFEISESDQVGFNIAHAFFHDDEPGSSSLSIKDVLEHMHPKHEKVIKIDLTAKECLENINADVLFVYEDGLWSGVELIRRLNEICKNQHFTQSSLQLSFKYGVTCDVGLAAARLFSKQKNLLNRLQFPPAKPTHHFQFLKDDFDTCLNYLKEWNDDTVRQELDNHIEPFAFQSVKLWGSEQCRKEAISVCEKIGEQLVKPFLLMKKQEKVNNTENNETVISDEEIAKWKLGACGFASTIVFASSIPKPVLPLMWLQGSVTLGDKTVKWKPLFWDARRTGMSHTSW